MKKFSFQFVFIMLIFLMLVTMSLMIIMHGKNIYTSINEDRIHNYEKRVSLSYLANKIRQYDKTNSIRIEKLNGENAIVISEIYDDIKYETWIYHYDNAIYEMFSDANSKFDLEDGLRIMEIENFKIEQTNNILKFTATSNNESTELLLCVYSY